MALHVTELFIRRREGGFGERELSPQLAQFQLSYNPSKHPFLIQGLLFPGNKETDNRFTPIFLLLRIQFPQSHPKFQSIKPIVVSFCFPALSPADNKDLQLSFTLVFNHSRHILRIFTDWTGQGKRSIENSLQGSIQSPNSPKVHVRSKPKNKTFTQH